MARRSEERREHNPFKPNDDVMRILRQAQRNETLVNVKTKHGAYVGYITGLGWNTITMCCEDKNGNDRETDIRFFNFISLEKIETDEYFE